MHAPLVWDEYQVSALRLLKLRYRYNVKTINHNDNKRYVHSSVRVSPTLHISSGLPVYQGCLRKEKKKHKSCKCVWGILEKKSQGVKEVLLVIRTGEERSECTKMLLRCQYTTIVLAEVFEWFREKTKNSSFDVSACSVECQLVTVLTDGLAKTFKFGGSRI